MARVTASALTRSLAALACAASFAAVHAADARRGAELYTSRCGACHSLDANRVGPMHRGVYGRKAGSVADYEYSAALKGARIVWEATTLDRWLTNPEALVPGQRMGYQLSDPAERADVIEYLRSEASATLK